jgi:hypothetical protein
MMSKAGDKVEALPPKFDDDGNPIVVEEGSKSGTSKTPTLEGLMKTHDMLKAKNKTLKAKGKKGTKYSSSSKDGDSSFEEEVSNKGRKGRNKHNKPSYNSMSFNYNNMSNSTSYTSIPVGKAPHFNGTNYNHCKHCMKNYLYSLLPGVWQVVCDGVDFRMKMNNQLRINSKRFITMHKRSPSSPHQLTRKSSTVWMAWMWPKMFEPLSRWHMKDQSL